MNGELLVSEMMIERFIACYPGLDVRQEIRSMQEWWLANPRRHRKNQYRFAVNWLNRSHAKALHAQIAATVQLEQRRVDAEVGKYRPGMPYYQRGTEWEL
jgi:hypothetical protein